MKALLTSTAVVALAEMGDKTQLLAFSLAARYRRPWAVMAGIFVATVLNHGLAAQAGGWVAQHVSAALMTWGLGISFLAFGIWTLVPDTLDAHAREPRLGPFLNTTVLFFLAEIGDKTQLATIALGAKFQDAITVTMGTTLGMMIADGLAVALGSRLARLIPLVWLRRAAAALFIALGGAAIASALRG